MKTKFLLLLFLIGYKLCFSQKQVNPLIDNDDRKKLMKARNLFNNSQIFDGEKIIRELIRKNPNQVYFYEALIQTQKQVLDRILLATDEWQQLIPSKATIDLINRELVGQGIETDEEEEAISNRPSRESKSESSKEFMESLGLDMVKINVKEEKGTTREERKKKRQANFEEEEQQDATVFIDSSIAFTPEEREEFRKINQGGVTKLDKKAKRKLKIIESFAQIPYSTYLYDMLQNARNATRLFSDADSSSLYLRQFLIDTINVNIDVKKEAWNQYVLGVEDYYAKEIPSAASHIEKALSIDDVFYSAHLKLGDIYYLMNRDSASVKQYQYAAVLEPTNPSPIEKLSIMLYNRGLFEESAAAAIEAIMKFPHPHLFQLLGRILEKTGRELHTQWIKREVFPLKTKNINEEIIVDDKSPWWHYQSVKQDVFNFYDTLGIVVPNEKTQERYLEVYAWKKMLNNSSPKLFQFARAMDKIGYLDCYVLISLFHIDLYSQYLDLVKINPEKVKKYFYILINWDDTKFDKIKKTVEVKEKPKETNKNELKKSEKTDKSNLK